MKKLILLSLLCLSACFAQRVQSSLEPEIIQSYRHDPKAFTEGLLIHEGSLFEGTGLTGQSDLRELDLNSGNIKRSVKNQDTIFGEGIAWWNEKIFQLTWKNKKVLVYDALSLEKIREFKLPTAEGWGLTSTGSELILSDGSDQIYFIDPLTFRIVRSIKVRNDNKSINQINELEWINGKIVANIWQTSLVMVIDPESGKVLEVWDLSSLVNQIPEFERKNLDVLNGIAWDADSKSLYVTGKFWPRLFEIRIPKSILFTES